MLTNVLNDDEGDHKLFLQVENTAKKRGSVFIPVTLKVSEEEHIKRIQEPTRLHRYKSIDPQDVHGPQELVITHKNLLKLDTTQMNASDAAKHILHHCAILTVVRKKGKAD